MSAFHTIGDLLLLMTQLVIQLWRDGRVTLFVACGLGLLLGGLTWWLTNLAALNFNRQFSFHTQHHVYCGVAAIFTLMFTLLFVALRYTEDVAERIVMKWEKVIQDDTQWGAQTFRKAYETVYELRDPSGRQLEDFAGKPHPDTGQNAFIPTSHEASKRAAAGTYAEEAVRHFRANHLVLSKILWAQSAIAQQAIVQDMERVFAAGPSIYFVKDAVSLAGERIRQELEKQTPRVILISRITLVIAFILIQAITLTLLVRAALGDIKEQRLSQSLMGR